MDRNERNLWTITGIYGFIAVILAIFLKMDILDIVLLIITGVVLVFLLIFFYVIKEYRTDIMDLKEKLDNKEKEISNMKNELNEYKEFQNKYDEYQNRLKELNDYNNALMERIKTLQKEKNTLIEENDALKSAMNNITDQFTNQIFEKMDANLKSLMADVYQNLIDVKELIKNLNIDHNKTENEKTDEQAIQDHDIEIKVKMLRNQGKTIREIANLMHISTKTVNSILKEKENEKENEDNSEIND